MALAENGIWSSLKPVRWGNEEGSSSVGGGETVLGEEDVVDSDGEVGGEDAQLADVFMDYANIPGSLAANGLDAPAPEPSHPKPPSSHSVLQPPVQDQTVRPLSDPPPNSGSQHAVSEHIASSNAPVAIAVHSHSTDEQAGSTHVDTHHCASTTPISVNNASSTDIAMDDSACAGHTKVVHTAPGMSMEGLTAMPDLDALEDIEMEQAANRDLARAGASAAPSSKRTRSPYVKWSQAEDDKLAQVCLDLWS